MPEVKATVSYDFGRELPLHSGLRSKTANRTLYLTGEELDPENPHDKLLNSIYITNINSSFTFSMDFMLQDDLYLGYYMHLVEDAFYRVFLYEDRMARPGTPEEVQRLHQDYHILNSYIVNKYNIHNILTRDISLAATPMGRIAAFHTREFLEALSHDFIEKTQGATAYLTEALLDEFVETYLPVAIQEIKSLREGVSALRAKAYAWPTQK